MYYDRYGPQACIDLRDYNDKINVEHFYPVPPHSQKHKPTAYKNLRQRSESNNIRPQLIKKPTSPQKKQTCLQRFIDALDHYCDTSSLHGLKYVGENRFSKPERFFWLVAFLIAVVLAIFFISQLFINYNNSPVIVSFSPEMVSVDMVPFPAITICNFNVALRSRAERIKRSGSPVERLILDDLCNSNVTNYGDLGDISWQTMENVIVNITQRCRELFVGCKWQGKTYECRELINSVLTDDGYCCSFNRLPNFYIVKYNFEDEDLRFPTEVVDWYPEVGYPADVKENTYPFRGFGRGDHQGLTLVLDAALHEYYCSTTNSFGFKVILHTPREAPKIADLGFLIQPGLETKISIEVEAEQASDSIRGIDYRKRKCFFAFEKYLRFYKIYNARNCLLECEANYTLAKCGCISIYLPRDFVTKVCDKSDEKCANQAKFEIERFGPAKLACDCLPGCTQIAYQPSVKSEGKLMNINNITFTEFLGNNSQAYFSENMAVVHFFYGIEKFQVRVKTPMYTFSTFLSNTGGLLGLFLGFGFLSGVEIIYFLIIRGACLWCQNRNNKTQMQDVFLQ